MDDDPRLAGAGAGQDQAVGLRLRGHDGDLLRVVQGLDDAPEGFRRGRPLHDLLPVREIAAHEGRALQGEIGDDQPDRLGDLLHPQAGIDVHHMDLKDPLPIVLGQRCIVTLAVGLALGLRQDADGHGLTEHPHAALQDDDPVVVQKQEPPLHRRQGVGQIAGQGQVTLQGRRQLVEPEADQDLGARRGLRRDLGDERLEQHGGDPLAPLGEPIQGRPVAVQPHQIVVPFALAQFQAPPRPGQPAPVAGQAAQQVAQQARVTVHPLITQALVEAPDRERIPAVIVRVRGLLAQGGEHGPLHGADLLQQLG